MSAKKSKQSHWPLSVLGGLTSILNAFLPLSLVRILTPNEVGQYKLFFFYLMMIPLVTLTAGISNGLFYWTGRHDKRIAALRTSWTLMLFAAVLTLAAGIIGHSYLTEHLSWTPLQGWLFVWTACATVISLFYEDTKIAMGEIWRGAIFSSGFEIVRNLTIIFAAWHFRSIDAVMWIYACMISAKTLVGMLLGYLEGYQRPALGAGAWDDVKAVARYSAPVSLAGLLSAITSYGDQIVLSTYLSATDFGIYSLGCLTVPPLLIFEISVNRVLIPNMSNAFAEGEPKRALARYRESVSELGWLLIPASVAMSIFAKPIVLLLFKEKFIDAAVFLRVYAFSYLAFLIPYDVVARARGDGRWILRFLTIFSPASLVALFIGTRLGGAMGTLMALMTMQFLMRIAALGGISKTEGWKLSAMIPLKQLATYSALTGLASVAAILVSYWITQPLAWFAVGGAAFSAIYLLGTMPGFFGGRSRSLDVPAVLLLGKQTAELLVFQESLKAGGRWNPVLASADPSWSALATLKIARQAFSRKVAIIHSHGSSALVQAVLVKWLSVGAIKVIHRRTPAGDGGSQSIEVFFARFADGDAAEKAEESYGRVFKRASKN
jgi:O-antigen/teichoic acid export membrane protein